MRASSSSKQALSKDSQGSSEGEVRMARGEVVGPSEFHIIFLFILRYTCEHVSKDELQDI